MPCLGGSWVVRSGVISRTIAITHIKGRITILITTHEGSDSRLGFKIRARPSWVFGIER